MITGDVTQVDLPAATESGLVEAQRVLAGVEGIGLMRFSRRDVVRHPLVQSIIEAYESKGKASRRPQAAAHNEDSREA